MCTFDQIRTGLSALDRVIQWDLNNLPQTQSEKDEFIGNMLGENSVGEEEYRINYLNHSNRYHHELWQMMMDVWHSLMHTPGGRKIAVLVVDYPSQVLGWRFNARQTPVYYDIFDALKFEIDHIDQWRPPDHVRLMQQVLASPRTDDDLLTFKLMM